MLKSIDIALTYAAFVMLFSFAYLSIAFVVYVWQAEVENAQNVRNSALPARLVERKPDMSDNSAMFYRSAALQIVQPVIVIPNDNHEVGDAQTEDDGLATAKDFGNDDAGAETSIKADANVPLTIVRASLTIWKRRGEQVVKAESIPCPIPAHIPRLRWRNAEVIRLEDLETIATMS
jgi:hypothetical protein